MTDSRLNALDDLMARGMQDGIFPGAVAHVRQDGKVLWHRAYGFASVLPERRPMRVEMVFDLASLTKPVATATAVLQLWERGDLDIHRPVDDYLPGFAAHGKAEVTCRHLLTHTGGLPAWIRLYLRTRSAEEAIKYVCDLEPSFPPGERVEYSDLGFIILGEIVRRLTGLSLDRYLDAHITPQLDWRWTRFIPPVEWRDRCVPTEAGNRYEHAASGGEGAGFSWRTELICCEVHDGNAYYSFGGVAGHAGLFSTAEEVGRFGEVILANGQTERGRVLEETTVREATRDHTGQRLGDGRGLGWVFASGSPQSFGARVSPRAFGHTGFTGTSILIDPTRRLVAVLLTNRVHPRATEASAQISAFRGLFHDAVIEGLEARSSSKAG